jgi:hypothetical protein
MVSWEEWHCPNCGLRDRQPASLGTRYHVCPKLHYLNAPMVREHAKVQLIRRQDYVGSDTVQVDDEGRPVMAIETTRDEGTDLIVMAPAVSVRIG